VDAAGKRREGPLGTRELIAFRGGPKKAVSGPGGWVGRQVKKRLHTVWFPVSAWSQGGGRRRLGRFLWCFIGEGGALGVGPRDVSGVGARGSPCDCRIVS